MAREIEGYRDLLARICEMFPGRLALTREETAGILGCSEKTVQRNATIPTVKVGHLVRVPIDGLARWMAKEGRVC